MATLTAKIQPFVGCKFALLCSVSTAFKMAPCVLVLSVPSSSSSYVYFYVCVPVVVYGGEFLWTSKPTPARYVCAPSGRRLVLENVCSSILCRARALLCFVPEPEHNPSVHIQPATIMIRKGEKLNNISEKVDFFKCKYFHPRVERRSFRLRCARRRRRRPG